MNLPIEHLADPLQGSEWAVLVPALAQGRHMDMLRTVEDLRLRQQEDQRIFPAREDVFRALELTPPSQVRVVILGQDPYHGAGQAHGLAFSVAAGVACPPSLKNIFKEIRSDIGITAQRGEMLASRAAAPSASQSVPNGDLSRWARQGVLLLNTVLTVEEGKAHSHAKLAPASVEAGGQRSAKVQERGGWQAITRAVLEALASGIHPAPRELVVLLWGKPAQAYADIFDPARHLVLFAAHPSPLSASRGFLGCGHFSRVNQWLTARGEAPICW